MLPIQNPECEISNITFLAANSSYSHSSLAYGHLRCITKKYAPDFLWSLVECTTKDNHNETVAKVLETKPHILLSTVYLFNQNFLLDLISKIALLCPKTIIVLGGPQFLGENENILREHPEISFVFRGDESSFPHFLNLLQTNSCTDENLMDIHGVCFITRNGEYFDGGKAVYQENLDSLPSPYEAGYFAKNRPFIQLETSRGCPSKCSFCTSSLSEKVQYYSLERIESDLSHIKNAGIHEVRIVDRTFNMPSKRATNLLKMFSVKFPDIKFHLEFNPTIISTEVVNQLKKAPPGQFHIETGVQTLHPPSSEAINRKSNKTKNGLQKLVDIPQIEIHADLIYGLPKQTIESVFNDLRELINIGPEEIQLESLKILPGTPISNFIGESVLQYSPTPPCDVLSTESMSLKDIIHFSYLSKIIDSYYNTKITQSLFRFAALQDNSFLEKFLQFAADRFSKNEKPSLPTRFQLFFDFASKSLSAKQINTPSESPDTVLSENPLYSLTLFSYFAAGFFKSPINNVEILKKNDLKALLKNNFAVLWHDNQTIIEKPAYLASFEYNSGELWLNPKAEIKKGKFQYLFLLSQGGMSKKISKIYGQCVGLWLCLDIGFIPGNAKALDSDATSQSLNTKPRL